LPDGLATRAASGWGVSEVHMSRRTLVALSAAVSAFILVVAGAVASYGLRSPAPSPAVATAASSSQSVPVEVVLAREAEYRRLIDEANSRLRAGSSVAPTPGPQDVPARASGREDDDDQPRTARRGHSHREHRERDDG
jgi:hypothetical protein